MRLARIELNGQAISVCVDADGISYPLGQAQIAQNERAQNERGGDEIGDLMALNPEEAGLFEDRIKKLIGQGDLEPVHPDRWLPPVDRPSKIIGVAMNNSAFQSMSFRYFTDPSYFMKAPSALIGHGEAVIVREDYGLTHPEAELACIIGRRSSHLKEEEARDAVFGYTIINDITSVGLKDEDSLHLEFAQPIPGQSEMEWRRVRDERDWDIYLTYHFRSKCTNTFGPIGPWITTANEVGDPNTLSVRAWQGDRQIAEDNTANLTFSVERVLAHLTRYTTLEPGDIVHFGTAVDPRRYSLREANIVRDPATLRIEIDRLGVLENPVHLVA